MEHKLIVQYKHSICCDGPQQEHLNMYSKQQEHSSMSSKWREHFKMCLSMYSNWQEHLNWCTRSHQEHFSWCNNSFFSTFLFSSVCHCVGRRGFIWLHKHPPPSFQCQLLTFETFLTSQVSITFTGVELIHYALTRARVSKNGEGK